MSATTIAGLLGQIEEALAGIEGLRVTSYVADQINPPAAIVGVPAIPSYRDTFGRGVWTMAPTVTVLVSATLDRVGQMLLAEYADVSGDRSVPAAIEADQTLNSTVCTCTVSSFRPLGLEQVGQLRYYGGVFTLAVTARGT